VLLHGNRPISRSVVLRDRDKKITFRYNNNIHKKGVRRFVTRKVFEEILASDEIQTYKNEQIASVCEALFLFLISAGQLLSCYYAANVQDCDLY
jgi:hypothetical protein